MYDNIKRLIEADKAVRAFGFTWPDLDFLLRGLKSEVDEVRDAVVQHESKERVQEELGDLFHNLIALILFLDYDVEHVVQQATEKFERRINAFQNIAQKHGFENVIDLSFDQKIALWRQMKYEEQK